MVNEILPSGDVLHLRNIPAPTPSRAERNSKKEEPNDEGAKEDTVVDTQTTQSNAAPITESTAESAETETGKQEQKDVPTEPEFQVSDEDNALLVSFFGPDVTKKIVKLHRRAMSTPKARPGDLGRVTSGIFTDRDLRTKVHQAIRRIFNSQLESTTGSEGAMTISAANNRFKRNVSGREAPSGSQQRGGRFNWDEVGGPYLHFTIYKENKDTMETISFLARQLKMNPKSFQFAGTKDRRGVTVQRACVFRVYADRLAKLNSSLRNATLGDFEYRKHGLALGDLKGNEFVVTLRECEIPDIYTDQIPEDTIVATAKEVASQSLKNLRERGYFNYYGLQRFGTFSSRTDTIGLKMLQGDFKAACEGVLHYSPHVLAAALGKPEDPSVLISTEDKARAEAIHMFETTGKINDAVAKLPRKFSAEACLIRHLGRAKADYVGALHTIPRNLRLMYVHAYQSLVWNFAAGERWRLYGDKVVEGDLVIINEHKDKEEHTDNGNNKNDQPAVDADGEVIITPQADDVAYGADDMFLRARALTSSEAASGKYSIFDIVLPLPGFDILYPNNKMTDFYKSFMAAAPGGALDPFNMRRKWKDLSLSGSYRKLLSRMGADYSYDAKLYSVDDEQFVQTDLESLRNQHHDSGENKEAESLSGDGNAPPATTEDAPAANQDSGNRKLAVILKFQLGSSQYATMALRELMKGKAQVYVPDFGGR